MAFFGGKTVLKFKKSENKYSNSTGNCEIYEDCATSYREKIAIKGRFKIGKKWHDLIFFNTHYWSNNTESHKNAVSGHSFLGAGRWIHLNFDGTMNDLCYYLNSEIHADQFKKCKVDDGLKNFISEYFPKQASQFIAGQIASEAERANQEKVEESARKIRIKISELDYANPKTFEKAILKFQSLVSHNLYLSRDIMKKDYAEIGPFMDVIAKYSNRFMDQEIVDFILNHKLKAFEGIGTT